MKRLTLFFAAFAAILVLFVLPAPAQKIIGHTSLGASATTIGNQIFSAPNSSTNKIYVSETPEPGMVTVIDGSTRTVLTTLAVGAGSNQIRVNPTTNTIYAFSGQDQTISVIDGSSDQVVATIPPVATDNCLTGIALDTAANQIAVLDECSQLAYILDGSSYRLLSSVSIPVGYAVDYQVNPTTHILYVVDSIDHEFVAANLATGVSTLVNLATLWPQSVAVDSTLNRVYMADNIYSSLYVFDGATNAMIATIHPPSDPYTVGVNQQNHVLAFSDGGDTLYFYNPFNLALLGQQAFPAVDQILSFSVNSNADTYYVGVLPPNVLIFVKGPV